MVTKQSMKQTFANPDVLNFYKILPFNARDSIKNEIERVRIMESGKLYPPLPQILAREKTVLEVGCGVGWQSNSIAYLYRCPVTGIDFNPVAIERSVQVANALQLDTRFFTEDLFMYEPDQQFDIVISFGVLHHTNNCIAAVERVCEKFVGPGGYVVIGLYHKYGRQPFLSYFDTMKKRGATEEEMLSRFKQLHSSIDDETYLISWFRDQVLIPHETQHTLEEMIPVLERTKMKLISTSINHFQPIRGNLRKILEEEKEYQYLGEQRLRENKYFPGFFIFLAQKLD